MTPPKKESKSKKKRTRLVKKGEKKLINAISDTNPHAFGTIYNSRLADYDPTDLEDPLGIDKAPSKRLSKLRDGVTRQPMSLSDVLDRTVSVPDKKIEQDIEELNISMLDKLTFRDSLTHYEPHNFPPPMIVKSKKSKPELMSEFD